jgi:predicted Zn-dependent peptidase
LIVTGKFDPDLVEKHIRYHFEPWPRGKAGTAVTAAAARRGGKSPLAIGVAGANAENLSVRVTFPLPAGVSPAHARLLVAAEMVGQQVSSIREEMGASYGFGASLVLNKGPGMLRVSGSVDAPRAGAALTSLLAGLDGLRQGGEDFDINFVIARREVVRQLMADAESSGAVATRLAFVVRHGLPLNYHRKLAAEVARLTSADVRAAIAEHLPPGEARVLLVGARPQLEAAFAGAGFAVDQVDWVE